MDHEDKIFARSLLFSLWNKMHQLYVNGILQNKVQDLESQFKVTFITDDQAFKCKKKIMEC